jgi:hypothetical protein
MTLPASGAISFNNINVELGVSGTTQASLGQTSYRNLAGVASGAISMSNFYGKANQFAFTIASNQTNANLRTLAVNAGWNQSSKVVATINGGVYLSSNSTGTPALTVNGSFPGGVQLTNNGFIVGMGGNGGNGPTAGPNLQVGPGTAGAGGGLALSVSVGVTITNNGTVAGGGGGGGGGRSSSYSGDKGVLTNYGGGGGGGGRSSAAANSRGGAGGSASGSSGVPISGAAGSVGTLSAAGAGGNGGYGIAQGGFRGGGGTGGGWGAAGATGDSQRFSDPSAGPYAGGSGGGAVSGNGNITWVATGTRLGGIS